MLVALLPALVGIQAGVMGSAGSQTTTTNGATATTPTTAAPATTVTAPPATSPPATSPPTAPPASIGLHPPDKPPAAPGPSSTSPTTVDPASAAAKASVAPDTARAYVDTLARTGGNSTGALLEALRPLETLGLSHDEVVKIGFGHFPVGGSASFRDDFHDPRLTPTFHLHQGNDIFAAFDTPVRAPMAGTLRFGEEPTGGKAAYVTTGDGTFYYMAHLNAFAPDLSSGASVSQGQIVGLVGDSGNAKGGAPHVHFEIHPGGGAAVNPKPILDGWLAEAMAAVPGLMAGYVQDQPPVLQATGLTRRFDMTDLGGRAAPDVEPLLWASSVSPAGSALRLAEVQLARVADGIDWERRASQIEAEAFAWRTADDDVRALLWRVTPGALTAILGGPTG